MFARVCLPLCVFVSLSVCTVNLTVNMSINFNENEYECCSTTVYTNAIILHSAVITKLWGASNTEHHLIQSPEKSVLHRKICNFCWSHDLQNSSMVTARKFPLAFRFKALTDQPLEVGRYKNIIYISARYYIKYSLYITIWLQLWLFIPEQIESYLIFIKIRQNNNNKESDRFVGLKT